MNVSRKFLMAELAWAAGIFVLMVPLALLDSDPPSWVRYVRWLARALGLAAFPAGIAIAHDVFAHPRSWRPLLAAAAAATLVAVILFALTGLVMPLLSEDARTLPQLANDMSTPTHSWERRNHAAWAFFSTLLVPLNALLFAAIGVQVGIWASYTLPFMLRRLLYWVAGLGLVISGYLVWDTTYETIVLHTAANASFAAFYTLLIPLSICAGLALPTLALLRRAPFPGSSS